MVRLYPSLLLHRHTRPSSLRHCFYPPAVGITVLHRHHDVLKYMELLARRCCALRAAQRVSSVSERWSGGWWRRTRRRPRRRPRGRRRQALLCRRPCPVPSALLSLLL